LEDGTILTNFHVIAGSDRVEVIFYDGTKANAKVVAVHPHNDLAILKPEKLPDDLLPATLGSSAQLKYGDDVVAVGFPFGIGPSVTSGVVSGLRREFTGENGAQLRNLIQFDAAINQGNSGGPLINSAGEVVGIVTALLNPSSTEKTFIGIGFAVTIESAGSAVGIPPF
jgi:S1-C subfamily serine protease